MEGKQNSAELEIYSMADKYTSRDTPSTPNPPTLACCIGSERNTDDRNTPETNLDVSALLLSSLTR